MNYKLRNELHEQALKQAKDFVKNGGKITKPASNYKGVGWVAPKPKKQRRDENGAFI